MDWRVVYDEISGQLDELRLTVKFPGNKTMFVQAQAALPGGVDSVMESVIIPVSSDDMTPAVLTILCQTLSKLLGILQVRAAEVALTSEKLNDECDGYEEEEEEEEEDTVPLPESYSQIYAVEGNHEQLKQAFQHALNDLAAEVLQPQVPKGTADADNSDDGAGNTLGYCPICDDPLDPEWHYCPNCGYRSV